MSGLKGLVVAVVAGISIAAGAVACGGAVEPVLLGGDQDSGAHDAGPRSDSPASDGGGPQDAEADADGSVDAGHDSGPPLDPSCPTSAPAVGSSCTHENLQCEYGGAWWSVSCDVVRQCQNGRWSTFQPSFEACTPEPGPNSPECPATFADVPQGACTIGGTQCIYSEGQCGCEVPLGGPVQIDGGNAYWSCVPEMGCPFPRPPLGSSCSGQSYCTYEECSYGQTCQGGTWEASPEACAGAGSAGGP